MHRLEREHVFDRVQRSVILSGEKIDVAELVPAFGELRRVLDHGFVVNERAWRDCSSSCRDSSSARLRQKVQSRSSTSRASASLFAAASAANSAALSLAAVSLKPTAGGSGAGSAARKAVLASTSNSAAAIMRMVMVRSCRPPHGGATIAGAAIGYQIDLIESPAYQPD